MSEKESRDFGLSGGDIGVIAIAATFALATLYLFFGPSPFASFFAQQQEKARTQTEEVSVGILPEKKP